MAREKKSLDLLGDRVKEPMSLDYSGEYCGFRLFSGASSEYDGYKEAHDLQQKRCEENQNAWNEVYKQFFGQDDRGDYPYTIRKRKEEFLFSFTAKRRMKTTREDTCGHTYPCAKWECTVRQERQRQEQAIRDSYSEKINATYDDRINGYKARETIEQEIREKIAGLRKGPTTEEDVFIGDTEFDHEFARLALQTKILY